MGNSTVDIYLPFILLILNLLKLVLTHQTVDTSIEFLDDEDSLCNDVDIRHHLRELHMIENCTVITGYLQFVMIERTSQQEFDKYQFPNLREVTGFVLFYDVSNLVSLRNMFPNLMVIRGQTLIDKYALIFYAVPQLQEIGLKGLIAIQNGFVNVQKCSLLCYTDTIDWASITYMSNGTGDKNYFEPPETTCNKVEVCRGCPRQFCWGSKSCQKFDTGLDFTACISHCTLQETKKCDAQCIGSCYNRTATGCRVCRGPKDGNRCVEKCPVGKVLYHETQRCISKSKCIERGKLISDGDCRSECSDGYTATVVTNMGVKILNHTCYRCPDKCHKVCNGMLVTSLADAERLQGCTIINGTLQIRMVEDHPFLVEELTSLLGSIEEIMGYLSVYRSSSLPSLEFLENLAVIHGLLELGYGNFSLMVYENPYLQKLWNYDHRMSLTLSSGSMHFVYNPMLCMSEIDALQEITIYNNTHDLISVDSNGFLQSCNVVSISVKSVVMSSSNVTIYWTEYNTTLSQQLLGFIVYYTPSDKERSPYDRRDVCSKYGWYSKLIQSEEIKVAKNFLSYNITGLKPKTRYAYYIKTYVVDNNRNASERKIGQSAVHYFTTKITKPTPPLRVYTVRKTDNSITFSWIIHRGEKNLVRQFRIDVFIQPDDQDFLDQRNYCLAPMVEESELKHTETCPPDVCCSDALSDEFDIPDIDNDFFSRRKRSLTTGTENYTTKNSVSDKFRQKMYSFLTVDSLPHSIVRGRQKRDVLDLRNHIYFHKFDAENKDFTVSKLLPYTYYTFQLFACSGREFSSCSPYSIYSDRTDRTVNSANITITVIKPTNNSNQLDLNTITVIFEEPKPVNGPIVAYNVEAKSLNMANSTYIRNCITRMQHERAKYRYIFHNLSPGNYTIRAQVISLGGPGPFSDWYFAQVLPVKRVLIEDHSLRNGFTTFAVLFGLTISLVAAYFWYESRSKEHREDLIPLVEHDFNEPVVEDGFVDCALR
ncbi:insulin-like receptor [Toxorhynchites rutilus septentrionalis]|uniref:insulin-like receptor n=1 Tax=Toxorhynchites rutilus septentrionalis TaxID=329112 RepID=UPI00247AB58A|nr:insulin-like receptor [Toxorhynchites rutilus septentrionalis]